MSYLYQTYSVGEVLTAAKMQQVEDNIRDHVHGIDGVSSPTGVTLWDKDADGSSYGDITSATTVWSKTVVADTLGENGALRIQLRGHIDNDGSPLRNLFFKLYWDGVEILSVNTNADTDFVAEFFIMNAANTAAQNAYGQFVGGTGVSLTTDRASDTVDTTQDVEIAVKAFFQTTDAGNGLTIDNVIAELIKND